ncbi:MAG: DNA mismatch repair protein MutL, partial [Bacteroidales bacterium]|nr:DNA mismatch repair protein MutL [Bacteroidales bacterium]
KHPALCAAIEKAYNDLVPDRYYPSYFLNLTVDPSRIDVNIHPTKTEVKFMDEHALFALLRAAAKKALGQFSLSTEIEFNPSTEIDFSPAPRGYIPLSHE